MIDLLDDLEQALADLMQMGLATAGPDMAARLGELSRRCEDTGLHTGSSIFAELSGLLNRRSHSIEKSDLAITEAMCRGIHYILLCRRRLTREDIRQRWQSGGESCT